MSAAGEGAGGWGQYRQQAGRESPVKWVGMSLALCNHGTCRCRCSSSKRFNQLGGREVTRKSFGITYLRHAFLRSENWWREGMRLAARARGADMGKTRLRGDASQYERMWMQITKQERLTNTSEVSVYFWGCHKM